MLGSFFPDGADGLLLDGVIRFTKAVWLSCFGIEILPYVTTL